MAQIQFTIEEINALYELATNKAKCLSFKIEKDAKLGFYAIVTVSEYEPTYLGENIRAEKLFFRVLDKPAESEMFGLSRLRYCGESSYPLFRIGEKKFSDHLNNIYITNN